MIPILAFWMVLAKFEEILSSIIEVPATKLAKLAAYWKFMAEEFKTIHWKNALDENTVLELGVKVYLDE